MTSLRTSGIVLIVLAFTAGACATALWLQSGYRWKQHIALAQQQGARLYDHLVQNAPVPRLMQVVPLPGDQRDLAQSGRFEQLPDLPRPALVTLLNVGANPFHNRSDIQLKIAAISPKLRYPLSQLHPDEGRISRASLAAISGLMARYCSDAVLIVHAGQSGWHKAQAPDLWHCDAAPVDRRVTAGLLAVVALAVALSVVTNLAAKFSDFATTLRNRKRDGRTKPLPLSGPQELRAIIDAVNHYRDMERQHLAERAVILSGVSHDLGTPATRLRLRIANIEDHALRQKLEGDIDQMTGIIESVLAYTRAELSTEDARPLSVTSLVQSIVEDYQDVGSPVRYEPPGSMLVQSGQTIFMSKRGQTRLDDESALVVAGRPLALKRAIGNLIDNALKYGRRAVVRLEADAEDVHILVEDRGGALDAAELETLTQPFQRGTNAQTTKGFGMGLTIVSSIALEHGGDLTFAPGEAGTIARLRIPR
jgi:signal transduction histidine kinase